MEREIIGLYGLGALFVLIMLRIPVALAMLVTGIGGTYVLGLASPFIRFEPYLLQFKTALWNSVANYDLSVVPLFILMGFLAAETGLSRDLFQGLSALTRKIKGGVAMATILACAGFGAVSGSSIATASTMSRVALPELRRLNYHEGLSTGVLAAGGTLGILIPPSVALVIYAIVVEASILEMFQAAIVPGIMAVVLFLIVIRLRLARNPSLAPALTPLSDAEVRHAIRRLLPVGLIFGAIILGLGFGLFTPTPAAAIGVFLIAVYGLLLRAFATDDGLTWPRLKAALLATASTSSMIYFILFAADILKGFFARSGLPAALSDWASASALEPYTILIAMLLVLIVLGCFMESLSMILVIVPFFWPVLITLNGGDYVSAEDAAFGMSTNDLRIWFGILALIVVELGLITPPVGLNVFVIKSFSPDTGIGTIFRGVAPFFAIEILRVAILIALPVLSLYLTRVL
ncbi:Sialic acid TRAP transporter permease protein SiaT [Rhodobacteraceae bacterium THAF1]|uniref:TRAP transporter large permease n=1 Tax=Palleronia sp. THAF1 TaxID=2587842 RepID=UPI000F3DFA9D|nr:TRAP transporter large permease [Palleronia sp. THAF1]QFU09217.1 Sialic acid TRAP transporter permease protein SiaT [Palleronia sp. THAF1]VDC27343.1 Sialic acid TRAP transporter permease protein SiaT [Rhodobacteraceae bacterium THAF1]